MKQFEQAVTTAYVRGMAVGAIASIGAVVAGKIYKSHSLRAANIEGTSFDVVQLERASHALKLFFEPWELRLNTEVFDLMALLALKHATSGARLKTAEDYAYIETDVLNMTEQARKRIQQTGETKQSSIDSSQVSH